MFLPESWHPPLGSEILFRDEGRHLYGVVIEETFTPELGWEMEVLVTAKHTISRATMQFTVYTNQVIQVLMLGADEVKD